MALSYVDYTSDGVTTLYVFPFPYIHEDHVKAYVDGVEVSRSVSGSNVTLTVAPANDAYIRIARETPTNSRVTDFQNSAVLSEKDLDDSFDQIMYVAQEAEDLAAGAMVLLTDGTFDSKSKRIANVADPVNAQDAVTKQWAETTMSSSVAQALTAKTTAESARDAALAAQTAAAQSELNAGSDAQATAADRTQVAADKASVAADKDTVAADKATVAADKVTVAADKAAAEMANTNAQAAKTSAENALQTFQHLFWGALVAPPVDAAVGVGDLYVDTSVTPSVLKRCSSVSPDVWVEAYSSDAHFTKTELANHDRLSVDAEGRLRLPRNDTGDEGSQLDLERAADGALAWSMGVYGSDGASANTLRLVDAVTGKERVHLHADGALETFSESSNSLTLRKTVGDNWNYISFYGPDGLRDYYAGVNGADAYIMGNDSSGDHLVIHTQGYVNTPKQPSFAVSDTTGSNAGLAGGQYWSGVHHNIGGHYNPVTGRFTAPVSGVYTFNAFVLSRSNSTVYLYLQRNGVDAYRVEDSRTGTFAQAILGGDIYLNAGDFVNLYVAGAGHYGTTAYTHFSMSLKG